MPTTISTNVVFTKQAAGNEAMALINAVIGNVSRAAAWNARCSGVMPWA